MKLITFDCNNHREIGLLDGTQVVRLKTFDPKLPAGLKSFLSRPNWRDICAAALASTDKRVRIGVTRVDLHTPIANPGQLFQINLNFPSHIAERKEKTPEFPQIFSKYGCRIISHEEDVTCISTDCELNNHVELCVVIGKEGLRIDEKDAMGYVAGYTVANHLTSVTCQLGEQELWLRSNSPVVSGLLLLGPSIVTLDEFEDPNDVTLRCLVNRREEQCESTKNMVFTVAQVIAFTSRLCRLYPGDLILMGTPSGVGQFRQPPRFLATEDSLVTSIEGIGDLKNTISFTDQMRRKRGDVQAVEKPKPKAKVDGSPAKDDEPSVPPADAPSEMASEIPVIAPELMAMLGSAGGGGKAGGGVLASRRVSVALAHLSSKQLGAMEKTRRKVEAEASRPKRGPGDKIDE